MLKKTRPSRSARHVCPFVNLIGPGSNRCHRPHDGDESHPDPGLNARRHERQHRQGKRRKKARLAIGLDPVVLDHLPRMHVVLPKRADEKRAEHRRRRISKAVTSPMNDTRQQIDRRHTQGKGEQDGEPPAFGHEAHDAQSNQTGKDHRCENRCGQDRAANRLQHAQGDSTAAYSWTPEPASSAHRTSAPPTIVLDARAPARIVWSSTRKAVRCVHSEEDDSKVGRAGPRAHRVW